MESEPSFVGAQCRIELHSIASVDSDLFDCSSIWPSQTRWYQILFVPRPCQFPIPPVISQLNSLSVALDGTYSELNDTFRNGDDHQGLLILGLLCE